MVHVVCVCNVGRLQDAPSFVLAPFYIKVYTGTYVRNVDRNAGGKTRRSFGKDVATMGTRRDACTYFQDTHQSARLFAGTVARVSGIRRGVSCYAT
jgi:hypothetical protein